MVLTSSVCCLITIEFMDYYYFWHRVSIELDLLFVALINVQFFLLKFFLILSNCLNIVDPYVEWVTIILEVSIFIFTFIFIYEVIFYLIFFTISYFFYLSSIHAYAFCLIYVYSFLICAYTIMMMKSDLIMIGFFVRMISLMNVCALIFFTCPYLFICNFL